MNIHIKRINKEIQHLLIDSDKNFISDGYHTFGELYEHRIILFIALCESIVNTNKYKLFSNQPEIYHQIWRSKLHNDGTSFNRWFILGIDKEKKKQVTYHLPISKWNKTDFAETLEKAPEYDGHTSKDILKRLLNL